jgi:Fur family transcriptional regulator, ferric uptake regulator
MLNQMIKAKTYQILPTPQGDAILKRLSEAGFKLTDSRRAVVELMLKRQGHFSASDIYEDTKREAPKVGRATVFRTLDLLSQMNMLERIHIGDGCHSYVICESHHHHHIICSSCGSSISFENCELEGFIKKLESQTNFRIHGHWLEVFGECVTCQQLDK